jgi:hypothetical protein
MAFSYCPHCGFKNMYSVQAPKFCGGCGESLNILSAAKTKAAPRKSVPRRTEIIDDPDGVDIYEVPNISKLSYSIENDRNKFDLKDLVPLEVFEKFEEENKPTKKTKKRGRPRKS